MGKILTYKGFIKESEDLKGSESGPSKELAGMRYLKTYKLFESIDKISGVWDSNEKFEDGDDFKIKFKVSDIIELSKDKPVEEVDPKSINYDFSGREEDELETKKRVFLADLSYPIIVVQNEQGRIFTMLDGTHRLEKALILGLDKIKVKVMSKEELIQFKVDDFDNLKLSEFFINEATVNVSSDWPDNWKDMPEWAQLQELGFTDGTTPQMIKNGNILLMNTTIPQYPGGITLQRSGYIRNKLASSGHIKNYPEDFTLKQMFDYLIERFTKLAKKGVKRDAAYGDLPDPTVGFLNRVVSGSWSLNSETQRIDVRGRVNMSMIKSVPEGIRFGNIEGDFVCNNMGLTNLDIAPLYVTGGFDCSSNKLTSLEGGPGRVDGNYDCSLNKLTTLRGAPEFITGWFVCSSNKLETLEGCPKRVNTRFTCSKNPLKSFEGSPKMPLDGHFLADQTHIRDLRGMPEAGEVSLEGCKNLKSIIDLPNTFYFIDLGGVSIRVGYEDYHSRYITQLGKDARSYIFDGIAYLIPHRDEIIRGDRNLKMPEIKRNGYIIDISIGSWWDTPKVRERAVKLFMTLMDNDFLDKYFTDHPMDIDLLDGLPDVKAGVLQRTGMKDISLIARSMRGGML